MNFLGPEYFVSLAIIVCIGITVKQITADVPTSSVNTSIYTASPQLLFVCKLKPGLAVIS